jgi:RNA polymerase sigma-70 factor (ECF subfamily)
VALNRAVAVAERDGPGAGLALIDELGDLSDYRLLHAARADLLRREEAAAAYERALALTDSEVERTFLARRLHTLRTSPG